jgi:hypothetical protein
MAPVTENHDPDGLECYSDHAHDIYWVNACTMCGSTEPNVVGHVLPDVERHKGITDPVKASAIVTHTKSAAMFDGVLLDHFSASAVQAVYNGLSTQGAKDKLRAMPLVQAVTVCFRVINKVEGRA